MTVSITSTTIYYQKTITDVCYRRSRIVKKGRFFIVTSSLLERVEGLFYGFFSRHGGVSSQSFKSLNVAYSTGDDIKNVEKNIELIRNFSGLNKIVQCRQVHGTSVVIADSSTLCDAYPEGDVLICSTPGIGLMIKTGDCQAILMVDPVKRVVAAVHCGWRGSVKNVIKHAVGALVRTYDVDPQNLIATIGPSLGPCCAEFIHYKRELPEDFWKYQVQSGYFDFWSISRDQLMESGLLPQNIEVTGWCTKCNPAMFFSYRRRKISGRMAALIGFLEDGS